MNSLNYSRIRSSAQQQINTYLWDTDLESVAFPKRLLIRTAQIIFAIIRDLAEGQLSLRAMSLVYSTILGFIPTLALVFAVLKSLGVHNTMEPTLNTLLEALGDRGEQVTAQIIQFVENIQVSVIGITSLAILIYLVLDMMRKIESSFNYIWCVSQGRSWTSRINEYLSAVIVTPLLLFVSVSVTSYVNTRFFTRFLETLSYGSAIIEFFALLFPLLIMSLAFALAYCFLPNTRVKFKYAFVGGIITTIVWKLMGAFFQGYLFTDAREIIYLAFATVLAVMIFTYIGWLVALLGSDIAYYLQHPNKIKSGRAPLVLSISQQETLILTTAALIIHRFEQKLPPISEEEISQHLKVSSLTLYQAIRQLLDLGLIVSTNDDPPRYLPKSSVSDSSLAQIWKQLRASKSSPMTMDRNLPEVIQTQEFLAKVDGLVSNNLGNDKIVSDKH